MDVHICADRPAAGFMGALALAMVLTVGANVSASSEQQDPALEKGRGLDLAAESRRRDARVWKAFGGFESQRAIDIGRQVAREVDDSRRAR